MSDRAVQDQVIRYLADANVRAQGSRMASISVAEAAKAARFAHFLARRYYRDRLARSFRYSHRFHRWTGRTAVEVVEGDEFGGFLHECVVGSLNSAKWVGELARSHLSAAPEPGPWWQDLLDYEYAYFLQAATAERAASSDRPSSGVSAVCRQFVWALPEMLPRLRPGESIGNDLRHEVMLLFSRTEAGRIYVVEVEPHVAGIFRAANGHSTVDEIATAANVPVDQAHAALTSLAGIGAVQLRS